MCINLSEYRSIQCRKKLQSEERQPMELKIIKMLVCENETLFPCISMYFLWWCHLLRTSIVHGAFPVRGTPLITQELTKKYYTTTRPLYITTNKEFYTHLGLCHIFTVNLTLGRDTRMSQKHNSRYYCCNAVSFLEHCRTPSLGHSQLITKQTVRRASNDNKVIVKQKSPFECIKPWHCLPRFFKILQSWQHCLVFTVWKNTYNMRLTTPALFNFTMLDIKNH